MSDFVRRQLVDGYIVIHHVRGDRSGIEFLRQTSRILLERLVLDAKRNGKTTFMTNDMTFVMQKERDGSFSIFPEEEQEQQIVA